jgi:hypothetical protein
MIMDGTPYLQMCCDWTAGRVVSCRILDKPSWHPGELASWTSPDLRSYDLWRSVGTGHCAQVSAVRWWLWTLCRD